MPAGLILPTRTLQPTYISGTSWNGNANPAHSITVPVGCDLLVVHIHRSGQSGGGIVSAVNFNGIKMTLAGVTLAPFGAELAFSAYIWYLVLPPAITANLNVTFTASIFFHVGLVRFYRGTDPSRPIDAYWGQSDTSGSSGSSLATMGPTPGQILNDSSGLESTAAMTAKAGQINTQTAASSFTRASSSDKVDSATAGWTFTAIAWVANSVVINGVLSHRYWPSASSPQTYVRALSRSGAMAASAGYPHKVALAWAEPKRLALQRLEGDYAIHGGTFKRTATRSGTVASGTPARSIFRNRALSWAAQPFARSITAYGNDQGDGNAANFASNSFTQTNGRLQVCFLAVFGAASLPAGWVNLRSDTSGATASIWYRPGDGTTGTVSITVPGGSIYAYAFIEIAGCPNGAGALIQSALASGSSLTPEADLSAFSDGSNGTILAPLVAAALGATTPKAGFAQIEPTGGGSLINWGVTWSAAPDTKPSATLANSGSWTTYSLEIKVQDRDRLMRASSYLRRLTRLGGFGSNPVRVATYVRTRSRSGTTVSGTPIRARFVSRALTRAGTVVSGTPARVMTYVRTRSRTGAMTVPVVRVATYVRTRTRAGTTASGTPTRLKIVTRSLTRAGAMTAIAKRVGTFKRALARAGAMTSTTFFTGRESARHYFVAAGRSIARPVRQAIAGRPIESIVRRVFGRPIKRQ